MAWEALASAGLNFLGKKQEQRWAKQAANRQMDFQREMSNTAYQRAMADMKSAGINPIMVSKLGGASTPTGAMARTPDMGKAGNDYMQNLATAKQVQLTNANIDRVKASTAKEVATTKEINQKVDSGYWKNVSNNLVQQDRKISTEILNIMANTSATRLSNTIKNWEFKYFKNVRGYPSQVLITTMENGMKTDLYHQMNKQDKQQYFKTLYNALDKIMDNADEVIQDPSKYISNNFSPLVASGLTLILGSIFKRKMNTKVIKHKQPKSKTNLHRERRRHRHGGKR